MANPVAVKKLDAIASSARFSSQSNGQVGLTHTRWSPKDDAFPLRDKMTLTQIEDPFLVKGRQGHKVEIRDLFFRGESGFFKSPLTGFALTLSHL